MQMNRNKKLLSCFLCMVFVVSMALFTAGCNGNTENQTPSVTGTEASVQTDSKVVGEGSKEFAFSVVDKDGNETLFEIHTDKETVGEALLEVELISGEQGDYGLFIKTVNGITADYDVDGTYWAFYINGEYAQSGVDTTTITEGDSYSLRVE